MHSRRSFLSAESSCAGLDSHNSHTARASRMRRLVNLATAVKGPSNSPVLLMLQKPHPPSAQRPTADQRNHVIRRMIVSVRSVLSSSIVRRSHDSALVGLPRNSDGVADEGGLG